MFDRVNQNIVECAESLSGITGLVLAYSGGLDSSVLLDIVINLKNTFNIRVVHVNHGLSEHADDWQCACASKAKAYQVEFVTEKVELSKASGNVEERARNARYHVFEKHLKNNELLLLAHHQSDQNETLLLNLIKGQGLNGLSAMPESRAVGNSFLFRPLLSISKEEIVQYAKDKALVWVEDESNSDIHFSRNYIRHEVVPKLKSRWPQIESNLSRSVSLLKESESLSSKLAEMDLFSLSEVIGTGERDMDRWGPNLSLPKLLLLGELRARNVLRYWIRNNGFPMPSHQLMLAAIDDLSNAKPDAKISLDWCSGSERFSLKRYQGSLFLYRGLAKKQEAEDPEQVGRWSLNDKEPFFAVQGRLSFEGDGKAHLKEGIDYLTVRYRKGGERCKPSGRSGSHPLKKLLQEYGVPPWYRDDLPLLYIDETLVAVADLWICEGYRSRSGQGRGICYMPYFSA